MSYFSVDRDAALVLELVAQATDQNPKLVDGYLIVAVRVDGSLAISHNTCCLPHMVNIVIDAINQNPSLAVPRDEYKNNHPR